jgi:hypothetical protein
MDRIQLLAEIVAHPPAPGVTVYLERRDDDFDWQCVEAGSPLPAPGAANPPPDAWLFYAGRWPLEDKDRFRAHLDDLIAEMDSMSGGADRCRWPLDQPYPVRH